MNILHTRKLWKRLGTSILSESFFQLPMTAVDFMSFKTKTASYSSH